MESPLVPPVPAWRLIRGAGVARWNLCLKAFLAVGMAAVILAPKPAPKSKPLPWQRLAISVDGVSLGQTRQQVEARLGPPARVFPKSGLEVLSYGKDFDLASFEFSLTTVGLNKLGHAVRISGQSLQMANFRPLKTGITTAEAAGWLGPPAQEYPPCAREDRNFYWSYRRDKVSLTITFSCQSRTATRFILQRLNSY